MGLTNEQRAAKGFVEVASPLLDGPIGKMRSALESLSADHAGRIDVERVMEGAVKSLRKQTASLVTRTLLVELHVARLEGRLRGATGEERFDDFVRQASTPEGRAAFFAQYPVLRRLIENLAEQWLAVWPETVARLLADWRDLETVLNGGAPLGQLTGLTGGEGDAHDRGRSVMIARFASGARAVYKPRSLALDCRFQDMLRWLAARGLEHELAAIRIIDRVEYGWVEFVEHAVCVTDDQTVRYHWRLGAYVALLYCLAGGDVHYENLIARGEHPVLVDLEALLHPDLGGTEDPDSAHGRLWNTVLGSMLLPSALNDGSKEAGADLSGMAGGGGQTVREAIVIEHAGTDEMRLARAAMPVAATHNRCLLRGEPVEPWRHTEDIVAGFTALYETIRRHSDEFLAGPLEAMRSAQIRVIPRSTRDYSEILAASYHPDYLRREGGRAEAFAPLHENLDSAPWLARLIPAETEALERGDIPMFVTRPDSRALRPAPGGWIEDAMPESSLDRVTRRIRGLGVDDLRLQQWLVRASMAASVPVGAWTPAVRPDCHSHSQVDDPLTAATAVGDRLLRSAIHGKEDVNWFGLGTADTHYWSVSPLLLDLYDGVPGVALFLADLGAVTGEERFTAVARRAAVSVLADLDRYAEYVTDLGGFTGLGGLVYALARLGARWNDAALIGRAEALAAKCVEATSSDQQFDIIAGSAGGAAALLALHRCGAGPSILDAAAACGNRLIDGSEPTSGGIGWRTYHGRMLSGFSHGAAGIAWALLRLSAATGDPRFRTAAEQAIGYERTLFDARAGNWLDVRVSDGRSKTVWCHGAPGIGLARLDTIGHFDDGRVRDEVRTAIETTIAKGFGTSDCLCHGTAGNLELLLRARSWDATGEIEEVIRRESAGLARRAMDGTCRMGTPLEVESPGLMTGLAGVGHGLLRLAAPDRVPSVLMLE